MERVTNRSFQPVIILRYGVFALLALLPFHSVLVLPGVSVVRVFGLILVPIWIIWALGRLIIKRLPIKFSKASITIMTLTLGLFLSIIISQFYAPPSPFFISSAITVLSGIVMTVIISTVINSERDLWKACIALAIGGVVASLMVITEFAAPELIPDFLHQQTIHLSESVVRARGFFRDPNYGAMLLIVIFCITFYITLATRALRWRFFMYGAVTLQAAAVVLTFSRASYITLSLVILLILWRERHGNRFWKANITIGMIVIVFVALGGILMEAVLSRAGTVFDFIRFLKGDPTGARQPDLSLWYRLYVALGGIQMAVDHFPFGVGWENFIFYISEYAAVPPHAPHNTYIAVAAELGLLGLFVLAFLASILWKSTSRICKITHGTFNLLANGIKYGLLTILFEGLFLTVLNEALVWALIGLIMALNQVAFNTFQEKARSIIKK